MRQTEELGVFGTTHARTAPTIENTELNKKLFLRLMRSKTNLGTERADHAAENENSISKIGQSSVTLDPVISQMALFVLFYVVG